MQAPRFVVESLPCFSGVSFESLRVAPLCIRKVARDGLQSGLSNRLQLLEDPGSEAVKKLGRRGVPEKRSRVLFEVLFVFSPPPSPCRLLLPFSHLPFRGLSSSLARSLTERRISNEAKPSREWIPPLSDFGGRLNTTITTIFSPSLLGRWLFLLLILPPAFLSAVWRVYSTFSPRTLSDDGPKLFILLGHGRRGEKNAPA